MPYTPNQKKKHIREFQQYLQGISYYNNKIPLIIPDGYFGKETATAVRAFQREYRIPETGTVTPETWNKAAAIYRRFIDTEPLPLDIFPSKEYIIRTGDTGIIVYVIQSLLNEMNVKYDNFPNININGIYDNLTASAVKFFQGLSNLPQTGIVNNQTWNMLSASIHHLI